MIDIAFEVNRDDYWAFNRFFMHRLYRRWLRLPLWLVVALLGLLAALLTILWWLAGDIDSLLSMLRSDTGPTLTMLQLLLLVMPLLILVLAVASVLTKYLVKSLPDASSGTLGPHRLRLTDQGVHDETSSGNSFTSWSGIREVAEDDAHVYLFVDRMAAYIIPKRVFDDAALQGFLAHCRAHL